MSEHIETAHFAESALTRRMRSITLSHRSCNLNNAIQLAMEAARGEGELVEIFSELGRRFGSSTHKMKPSKRSRLSVIEGGRV